jgi:hypothetical protein
MSDTSLYAGLYEEMRGYAELVDDILLDLREDARSPDIAARQRLGGMLVKLAENQYDELSSRLIILILQDRRSISRSDMLKIGRGLLSPHVEHSVVAALETFAHALEQAQADTLTRMRGATH